MINKGQGEIMKRIILMILVISMLLVIFTGCDVDTSNGSQNDIKNTQAVANQLQSNQSTPTDLEYSLERYNLIRRAYWVNGHREKANALICEITKPMGYIVLFSGNTVVGSFTVDGKVSSLNSFLTPSTQDEYITNGGVETIELPDIDGSYGKNDNGIFFFTTDGKYVEWTGTYLYSDIPMQVDTPVVNYEVATNE
jgi:hypothetical protein